MFNNKISFDLPTKISQFSYKGNIGKTDLAASGIGQGKTLVTPLNMAMVASSIANDGVMVKPILVKEIVNKDGKILRTNKTEVLSTVGSSALTNEVKEMMMEVVQSGTGTNGRIKKM